MTDREKQIGGLVKLALFITPLLAEKETENVDDGEEFYRLLRKAEVENPWFTQENLEFALRTWSGLLTEENLKTWTAPYAVSKSSKRVGLILAGNIPLVGFHDVLAVILSGHTAVIKLSSKDKVIIPYLLEKWETFSGAAVPFELVEKLQDVDAVIATGSNNTARYLEYYFRNHLNIIRKNRTSVAVLHGGETPEELAALAEDIFRYFGLGCRNVTRLFLPDGFVLDRLFEAFTPFGKIINHHRYANNYEYNRAVYLLNQVRFWDNNFVLLREDEALFSPLAVINFTFYTDLDQVRAFLDVKAGEIQTVVANPGLGLESIGFGEAQHPDLQTYADNVNVMEFLQVI